MSVHLGLRMAVEDDSVLKKVPKPKSRLSVGLRVDSCPKVTVPGPVRNADRRGYPPPAPTAPAALIREGGICGAADGGSGVHRGGGAAAAARAGPRSHYPTPLTGTGIEEARWGVGLSVRGAGEELTS
jgi:hypothetical protein